MGLRIQISSYRYRGCDSKTDIDFFFFGTSADAFYSTQVVLMIVVSSLSLISDYYRCNKNLPPSTTENQQWYQLYTYVFIGLCA